jgi:hypothetical protein
VVLITWIWWIVTVDFFHHAAILKAIADKLIPGIATSTRISILQQTTFQKQERALPDISGLRVDEPPKKSEQSALQYVVESDAHRNDYLREVAGAVSISMSITLPRISMLNAG